MSIIEKAVEKKSKAAQESGGGAPVSTSSSLSQSSKDHSSIERALGGQSEQASAEQSQSAIGSEVLDAPGAEASAPQAAADSDGTIDLDRLRALGMVTPDMSRSKISEEYRLIKRPLLKNAFGQGATVVANGNLIMVTSSLPGEGKTFTAVNLAMSIALELDKTVLLVDADVAKRSMGNLFGVKAERGLVDYLLGETNSLSDILIRTNVPKLVLLPAGKRHVHSTELLASENMKSLLQELCHRYPDRVVIFDSPPLLATSEASVLASQMGQLVMVVETARTSREALREALALVDPAMIVGLVLNKSGQAFGTDYYGAYSYYGT